MYLPSLAFLPTCFSLFISVQIATPVRRHCPQHSVALDILGAPLVGAPTFASLDATGFGTNRIGWLAGWLVRAYPCDFVGKLGRKSKAQTQKGLGRHTFQDCALFHPIRYSFTLGLHDNSVLPNPTP